MGKSHKSRSDDDRKFGRHMIPTISLDHCFLGSVDDDVDKMAHGSLFLVLLTVKLRLCMPLLLRIKHASLGLWSTSLMY